MNSWENPDYRGLVFEAAMAERQHGTDAEMFESTLQTIRHVALVRAVSGTCVKLMMDKLIDPGALPIREGVLAQVATSYGTEALAYRYVDSEGNDMVLKVYPAVYQERDLAYRKTSYDIHRECFGEAVATTHFVLAKSPYSDKTVVLSQQPWIAGTCFFTGDNQPNEASIRLLQDGTEKMRQMYGRFPDYGGDGNIIVDAEGDIHFVDTGNTKPLDDDIHIAVSRLNAVYIPTDKGSIGAD